MTLLSLSLLGTLQIALDGQPVKGFESNRVRALLIYLAVEAAHPHRREVLAALLWPEQPEHTARNNLRQAISNLRRTLRDREATKPVLQITSETVQFRSDSDHLLDMAIFQKLIEACTHHPHRSVETCRTCLQRLEQATQLYQGNFLHDFFLGDSDPFEQWASLTRERLHYLALETLTHLVAAFERRGALEQAVRYARRLLELDPWNEVAHRGLMRLLFQNGQRNAALAQFEACRRVLAEALDLEPESETVALYHQIRGATQAPDPSAAAMARQNLPPQPGQFVGRETELNDLAEMLGNPACRLLTIAGPGGIGKTRLALEAATQQVGAFAEGVFFVPLAALGSADFLISALATALHLPLQAEPEPKDQLIAALQTREILLVLDNFEHMLPRAEVVSEMLERCPHVTLLITSRERLDLRWEWIYDIDGLAYPTNGTLHEHQVWSALQLFAQRARQVRRQFTLTGAEAIAAADICRQVEGMPLAIELAAAMVRDSDCQEIAIQLRSSLGSLGGSLRDMPARHRNLRAVFDHSWHLLEPAEQRLLRQLAVFRGGFDLDAAEAITDANQRLVFGLVAKSLVRAGLDTSRRYDLHEVLRQFAYERLQEAEEVEMIRQRHAAYFLTLAETAEHEISGARQHEWLERLEVDHDNLRASIAGAVERGDTITAARISGALFRFWEARGYLSEGRHWLELSLANVEAMPHAIRTKALHGAGAFAFFQGDATAARSYFQEGLALCRSNDDRHGIALMLNGLGTVVFQTRDNSTARTLLEESLTIMRELGDRGSCANALNNLGTIAWSESNYPAARALFEESLALQRQMGDEWNVAYALNNLGSVASKQGDYHAAYALLAECLTILDRVGDKRAIASTLEEFAILNSLLQQSERSLRLSGAAAALRSKINAPLGIDGNATLDEHLARASQALDVAASAAAWAEGQTMTLEQAIAYALEKDLDT